MSNDEIMRMMKECDLVEIVARHPDGTVTAQIPNITNMGRFAALVAAAEREACAQIVERPWQGHFREVAAEIRARGQA